MLFLTNFLFHSSHYFYTPRNFNNKRAIMIIIIRLWQIEQFHYTRGFIMAKDLHTLQYKNL